MAIPYTIKSLPALLTDILTPGLRDYEKLADYFANHTEYIKGRGVMTLNSVSLLSLINGADSKLVLVVGDALYMFDPVGGPGGPLDKPASGGGYWKFILPATASSYHNTFGDGVATSFNIPHNLGTLFPLVEVFEVMNGLPYLIDTTGTVRVLSANIVNITYIAPPAPMQFTAIIRK